MECTGNRLFEYSDKELLSVHSSIAKDFARRGFIDQVCDLVFVRTESRTKKESGGKNLKRDT